MTANAVQAKLTKYINFGMAFIFSVCVCPNFAISQGTNPEKTNPAHLNPAKMNSTKVEIPKTNSEKIKILIKTLSDLQKSIYAKQVELFKMEIELSQQFIERGAARDVVFARNPSELDIYEYERLNDKALVAKIYEELKNIQNKVVFDEEEQRKFVADSVEHDKFRNKVMGPEPDEFVTKYDGFKKRLLGIQKRIEKLLSDQKK